jgi:hypothetical protein
LRNANAQPHVLRMANFNQTFTPQTDASVVALGAVLSQETQGVRQPAAYASRTLTSQGRKASFMYELEQVWQTGFPEGHMGHICVVIRAAHDN